MHTVNIKPHNVRIPIVTPRASKRQAIEAINVDDRMKFIYSGLLVADTIDGYILELTNDVKNSGIFRQGFKGALNEMKRKIESYKLIMYRSCNLSESIRLQLADNLDALDDSFGHDMKILFHSIKRYVEKFIPNTDHSTCIARASVIELLSAYSLKNDDTVSRAMMNATGRNIRLEDTNIKGINFQARKFISDFASLYGEVDINLNNCDEIFTAFSIIDKKMNRIHELLK